MALAIPIFRIFDYQKAVEFYIDWLGFTIDWKHQFEDNTPIYMQVSMGDLVFHLSEHHGDSTPGTRIFIRGFEGLTGYHKKLLDKNYRHNRPGLEQAFWDEKMKVVEVIDPFGNRITFTGE